jgi:hypothetical protein
MLLQCLLQKRGMAAADDDTETELREATWLIVALQRNHAASERAPGFANTRLLHETRHRAPRRLWPRIGERVAAAMPTVGYRAVVFLLLDMQSPPDGPYIPGECFGSPALCRGPKAAG